jgi:hypothetical protein
VKEYLAPDGDASLDQLHELVGSSRRALSVYGCWPLSLAVRNDASRALEAADEVYRIDARQLSAQSASAAPMTRTMWALLIAMNETCSVRSARVNVASVNATKASVRQFR